MTKEELLKILEECAESFDNERAHADADKALIEYINDSDIEQAYKAIDKWYA